MTGRVDEAVAVGQGGAVGIGEEEDMMGGTESSQAVEAGGEGVGQGLGVSRRGTKERGGLLGVGGLARLEGGRSGGCVGGSQLEESFGMRVVAGGSGKRIVKEGPGILAAFEGGESLNGVGPVGIGRVE